MGTVDRWLPRFGGMVGLVFFLGTAALLRFFPELTVATSEQAYNAALFFLTLYLAGGFYLLMTCLAAARAEPVDAVMLRPCVEIIRGYFLPFLPLMYRYLRRLSERTT